MTSNRASVLRVQKYCCINVPYLCAPKIKEDNFVVLNLKFYFTTSNLEEGSCKAASTSLFIASQ